MNMKCQEQQCMMRLNGGGGADGMQGGWARRQGKHDCSDDDEEQRHPHPKMRTSRNNDHCQHQREAFDNLHGWEAAKEGSGGGRGREDDDGDKERAPQSGQGETAQ